MQYYFVKTPAFITVLFNKWIWRFSRKEKAIYLTFDDGPTPEITLWVLDQLKKYDAKATFFCIGKNVEKHPEIFQSILNNEHAIGNHTYNHLNGWKTSVKDYIANISKTAEIIKPDRDLSHSQQSKIFRPPYGKITGAQSKNLRSMGYKIIMWDVLSADFDTEISKETCLNNVLKNTKNGSIVVFHDSIKSRGKLYHALPKVLEYFSEKGICFKKIENLQA